MDKKKKISDSELRLILLLLSVVILAAAYFFIYDRNVKAAQELEAQNEIDSATVARLEGMVAVRAQVEAETEQLRQNIKEIVAKYPADMTTEKAIYVLQNIEDYTDLDVPNVSFMLNNLLMNFNYPSEETGIPPSGFYASMSMNYSASYADFKHMLAYIASLQDRMTAPTVSATYDRVTNLVSGSITMNLYYLRNTGKEYVAPVIPGIDKGVTNIFGDGEGNETDSPDAEEGAEENADANTDNS